VIGLGGFTLGSTPFGAGTPAEAIAPSDDSPELSNFIDPRTGDYVVNEDGSYQRMPITRQRVMMLVSTRLGSAVEQDIGIKLPEKIDQSFPQRVREAVLEALLPIGEDIRIDSVTTNVIGTGRADITVAYTDLTTGNSDTVTI
jgi:phage baseplate assembly protein W